MASLQDIFVSKVRAKLIKVFLSKPEEIFYVRQLVRITEEEINAVRRELLRMEQRGLVAKEKRGNRLYYRFRKDYLFYDELLRLTVKTTGLGQKILKDKNKIGKIKYAFLTSHLVKKKQHKENDIDFLIVGEIVLAQLAAIVSKFEADLKREINYSAMSKQEFEFRKKRRDPFILRILAFPKVMLIGSEDEMLETGDQ